MKPLINGGSVWWEMIRRWNPGSMKQWLYIANEFSMNMIIRAMIRGGGSIASIILGRAVMWMVPFTTLVHFGDMSMQYILMVHTSWKTYVCEWQMITSSVCSK